MLFAKGSCKPRSSVYVQIFTHVRCRIHIVYICIYICICAIYTYLCILYIYIYKPNFVQVLARKWLRESVGGSQDHGLNPLDGIWDTEKLRAAMKEDKARCAAPEALGLGPLGLWLDLVGNGGGGSLFPSKRPWFGLWGV